MDESLDTNPHTLSGNWINLFDPRLAVMVNPHIAPNTRWLLYDLSRCPATPWVIAAAGRLDGETFTGQLLTCKVSGMADTLCCLRARLPQRPAVVTAGGQPAIFEWDEGSQTVLVEFPNLPEGQAVEMRW
jgi:hypothetical protein